MRSGVLCFFVLLLTDACAQPQQVETNIETTLTTFAEAFRTGDYETVEAHISDNYVHVNGDGAPYDRVQWLEWYKGYAKEIANGDHVFEDYAVQSLEITRHDDAAYVTGVVRANGERFGEAFTQNIRFTNLWIIENGKWKRAGFHDAASSDQED